MHDPLQELSNLIDRFRQHEQHYKRADYDEANTRVDFIDRFFELLGWDVTNRQGYAEAYREVVREDTVVIAGKPKAPDYSFRIGGVRKFFVEAKRPGVNIHKESGPAYQVRRYGYTARLPLSVLTDFEEFSIYDTRIKPSKSDSAATARMFYCTYREYLHHFNFLSTTLSKDAIQTGSFDRYVAETKDKRGTSEVDREFLKLIEEWRAALAKNIALRNSAFTIWQLNWAVQKIIDQIIFLRIAEDRRMEDYGILRTAATQSVIYKALIRIFAQADKKYNSGLFRQEDLLNTLVIDNPVLKSILNGLYYPDCPYEFSVLSTEILGNIYEQFLGKTIRLTPSHQAKVEEKPEVRKAGGVYYTPQYIVEYILTQTVGVALKDAAPAEARALRICDPACGSGSFLLGAYQYLLVWYLRYYCDHEQETALKAGRIYQYSSDSYRLTIQEKREILCGNIFGVDIDQQAVEVTKLSLLLKLMEDESTESSGKLFRYSDQQLLPDLSSNIKCGNSLIGNNYYEGQQLSLLSEENLRRVNAFDWEKEFSDVFSAGGFDIVLGNPPYGAELNSAERQYLERTFQLSNTDTACLFMGLALKLLSARGINGYIISKPFIYSSNWRVIRKAMLEQITEICDCGKVWREVKLEQIIYLYVNNRKVKNYRSCVREGQSMRMVGTINKSTFRHFGFYLNGISNKELPIGEKMRSYGFFLNDYVANQRGCTYQKYIQSEPSDWKVLGGKQLSRYAIDTKIKGYLNQKIINDDKAYIKTGAILVQNIVAHIQNPTPRIMIIAAPASVVNNHEYVIVDTINQLENRSDYSAEYITAILNSRLISWYAYGFIFGRAIRTMHFDIPVTSRIPMPPLNLQNKQERATHNRITDLAQEIIKTKQNYNPHTDPHDQELYRKKLLILEGQIDELVSGLYNLTQSEVERVLNTNI